jgi:cytochrome c556
MKLRFIDRASTRPAQQAGRWLALTLAIATGMAPVGSALAQHVHAATPADAAPSAAGADHSSHPAGDDARQWVRFPVPMAQHQLANMRDHLLALAQIQDALAQSSFDKAAQIAETRLGMTSLQRHGAHEASKYMPQAMQDIGTAMHHGASRFAIEAQNASASGDLKPALAALALTTQACVACHAAYRLQ